MKKGEHNGRWCGGDRGLYDHVKIIDTYNQTVTLRTSSSIDPACWIFCKDEAGRDAIEHLGKLQARSPHLSPMQARRLAAALNRFADAEDPPRRKRKAAKS